MINQEKIIAAAIMFDGVVWSLPKSARHHDIIQDRTSNTQFKGSAKQGFLTSHDRFVDRKTAAEIAFATAQIVIQKSQLFSEDVW